MELQTCWTLVQDAARGASDARQRFSTLYVPIIHSALTARWRGRANSSDVDDAVQEVILDCLREDGVLERASNEIVNDRIQQCQARQDASRTIGR